jgi:HAD superfamily hydrolase (TIGR01509 family)
MKPRLFIGSSVESIEIAYAVQDNLQHHVEATVWDQGIFELSRFALESLLSALDSCNFGVFVFSPDDVLKLRGEEHRVIRDNIIFELGLFIGRLGRDRSFVIMTNKSYDTHLPTDLLGVNLATFDPDREDHNLLAALGPACHRILRQLRRVGSVLPSQVQSQLPDLVSRAEFTSYLLDGLLDPNISAVTLVTYTAEVDSGLFNRFHILPNKQIAVYKRSILEDLAEQQEYNMKRLAAGIETRHWSKKRKSMQASRRLAEDAPSPIKISQFLYLGSPSRRVYMMDDAEAMVAYYEVVENLFEQEGSLYRGITDSPAMKVNRSTPVGEFFLDEIKNFITGLRHASRTWEEEKAILADGAPWSGGGRRPCVTPKAVFFDVDGVLLDSLPIYVSAWKKAFLEVGIEFAEKSTYYEEGRNGLDTIRRQLHQFGFEITDDVVNRIHRMRDAFFREEGPPPAQEGARELLSKVAGSDLEIWVVTGSSDPELKGRLLGEFGDLINPKKIITGSDARVGKPDPDSYLLACSRASIHPHEGVAIENSPLGIRAADAAGLFCMGVNSGILEDIELEEAGARAVFKSCSDLARKWPLVVEILRE